MATPRRDAYGLSVSIDAGTAMLVSNLACGASHGAEAAGEKKPKSHRPSRLRTDRPGHLATSSLFVRGECGQSESGHAVTLLSRKNG